MKQFMLQGKAITGPTRYRECFCPRDLLRHRELAAGFFQQHYRFLSYASLYHAEMFYFATFYPEKEFHFSVPQEYCCDDWALCSLPGYRQRAELREHFSDPARKQSLKELWNLSCAVELPEQEQQRLFCLLAAGYGLANQTLRDCPLTPEDAKYAYLRQTKDDTVTEDGWLILERSGNIVLPAQEKPYRILMGQGAEKRLEAGAVITPRKLLAAPHPQGSRHVPVTLRLYTSPSDPNPRELQIHPGDYRYVNFVEEIPVWFHPVSVQTPGCKMERLGGTLYVSDRYGASQQFDCSELEIVGFAPEWEDMGWVLLSELGTDYSAYSHRLTYGALLPDEDEPIVQAEFRQAECLLLDQHGYVHSNLYPVSKTRVPALHTFRR